MVKEQLWYIIYAVWNIWLYLWWWQCLWCFWGYDDYHNGVNYDANDDEMSDDDENKEEVWVLPTQWDSTNCLLVQLQIQDKSGEDDVDDDDVDDDNDDDVDKEDVYDDDHEGGYTFSHDHHHCHWHGGSHIMVIIIFVLISILVIMIFMMMIMVIGMEAAEDNGSRRNSKSGCRLASEEAKDFIIILI